MNIADNDNADNIVDNMIELISKKDISKLAEVIEKYPDTVNKTLGGITPLAFAVKNNAKDAAELLLIKNADKNCIIDGENALIWAKKQNNNDAAFFLIAWDYVDRIYAAAEIWKKYKLDEAYCDVCIARITAQDSVMLKLDEVFLSDEYVDIILKQAVKFQKQLKNKSKDELLETIKENITKTSITGRYFVCEACAEKYFYNIIFGCKPDKVIEIVNSMFDQTE